MKKYLLYVAFFMAVYIGCVIWVTWGLKLEPADKFLICCCGLLPFAAAGIVLNVDEK